MSYVRFGEDGSDVYVFDSVGNFIDCCGCHLAEGWSGFQTNSKLPESDQAKQMLAHLDRHREAGHTVPEYVYELLRAAVRGEKAGPA